MIIHDVLQAANATYDQDDERAIALCQLRGHNPYELVTVPGFMNLHARHKLVKAEMLLMRAVWGG